MVKIRQLANSGDVPLKMDKTGSKKKRETIKFHSTWCDSLPLIDICCPSHLLILFAFTLQTVVLHYLSFPSLLSSHTLSPNVVIFVI